MATVYLAQGLKHQRQMAIKVFRPELAAVPHGPGRMTVRSACPSPEMAQIVGVPFAGGTRMGYRRFTDPDGHEWEVRDITRSSWEFHPVPGNPGKLLFIDAPGYEADPFELSVEELQRLLGKPGGPGRARPSRSPFKD